MWNNKLHRIDGDANGYQQKSQTHQETKARLFAHEDISIVQEDDKTYDAAGTAENG